MTQGHSDRPFRLGVVMMRPTQFEAPFFKFTAQDADVDVRVLYLEHGAWSDLYDPELDHTVSWGFDLYDGYRCSQMPQYRWLRWLLREITPANFDALIINGYYSTPLFAAAAIARARGIRTALRLDSVALVQPSDGLATARLFAKGQLYRLYDHYFAVSSLTAALLKRMGIPLEHISFFTYAIDVEHYAHASTAARGGLCELRRGWGVPQEARVVLAVSKLSPRETPWDLLRAFEKIQGDDAFLLVVGDGPDRSAAERFVAERLAGRAAFVGYVPYPDLPKAYAVSDLYVHAAADEPWGVSVAEAMACGLPVITSSRVGAGYDLISEGENGFLYEYGNPEDLAGKLERILAGLDPARVAEANARILGSWNYRTTWENIRGFCLGQERRARPSERALPGDST